MHGYPQGKRSAVQPVDVARLAWAAVLLTAPDALLAATGTSRTRTRRVVARVLGARHALQGAALIVMNTALPLPPPLTAPPVRRIARAAGAAADLAHGVSAFSLAVVGCYR